MFSNGVTTVFYLIVSVVKCGEKSIFDLDIDGIFRAVVGNDVHNEKKYLKKLYDKIDENIDNETTTAVTTDTTVNHTTEIINVGTTKPNVLKPRSLNVTRKLLRIRKLNRDLKRYLERNEGVVPNFQLNFDDPNVFTRRFDRVKEEYDSSKDKPTPYRRLDYFYTFENVTMIKKEKRKMVSTMENLIYRIRYKLTYAQLMRKKYRDGTKYKLGFCFGMLRHLKQHQMQVYSVFRINKEEVFEQLFTHMKLYEKILRLDVDIKDLIRVILQLDHQRRVETYPYYYDGTFDRK